MKMNNQNENTNNLKDIPMEVDNFQSSGLSAQFSAELDRVALAIAIRGLE